ncbi:MAG: hypothetical protein KDI56_14405 [Xanthomonadales bacterium]|nr:hypothetical protein [Xanthomonadales bacterium]
MCSWYIETRAEFFEVLDRAITQVQARCNAVPAQPMYRSILRQLQAMQAWTADGRTPLEAERDRIDIGLIAIREIDPQDDDDNADLHELLVQLGGYFEEWPDDETPIPEASETGSPGAD